MGHCSKTYWLSGYQIETKYHLNTDILGEVQISIFRESFQIGSEYMKETWESTTIINFDQLWQYRAHIVPSQILHSNMNLLKIGADNPKQKPRTNNSLRQFDSPKSLFGDFWGARYE